MFYSDEFIAREIIMDHISSPRNIGKEHQNYLSSQLKNPSCGDTVTVYVLLDNNSVKDITYDIEGCSICKSSMSMASGLLKGSTLEKSKEVIAEFNKMVTGEEYNEDILEDAASLYGVVKFPPRIKCATLGYKAFEEAIKGNSI